MSAPLAHDLIDLQSDAEFIARLMVAFATVGYATATAPAADTPADVRQAQLNGVRFLADDSSKARELAQKSVMLVIGSPEVRLAGAAVSDNDLVRIAGKVMAAYTEFVAGGGKL